MRCSICDSTPTRKWRGDYYCNPCRESILSCINEDKDNNDRGTDEGLEPILHSSWGEDK